MTTPHVATKFEARETQLARIINILALFALLGVLAGSLHLQLGVGEQPCPLCLIQRSAMIGLAVGPIMNLLWGMKPRHYALSILAALVGSAGSIRQILLHIANPDDPGYGPAIFGYHLYTWAFITFVIAIAGCSIMLMWQEPFLAEDSGVLHQKRGTRIIAFTAMIWMVLDLLIIAISVIPECGLGMCPDDPEPIEGAGDIGGWLLVLSPGVLALALAAAVVLNHLWPDRQLHSKPQR